MKEKNVRQYTEEVWYYCVIFRSEDEWFLKDCYVEEIHIGRTSSRRNTEERWERRASEIQEEDQYEYDMMLGGSWHIYYKAERECNEFIDRYLGRGNHAE